MKMVRGAWVRENLKEDPTEIITRVNVRGIKDDS